MFQLYKDMFGDGKLLEGAERAKAVPGKKRILDHTTISPTKIQASTPRQQERDS